MYVHVQSFSGTELILGLSRIFSHGIQGPSFTVTCTYFLCPGEVQLRKTVDPVRKLENEVEFQNKPVSKIMLKDYY